MKNHHFTFILGLFLTFPAYAEMISLKEPASVKSQYSLELMSAPFVNALNLQYSITEHVSIGAGTSVNFLRFPEEIKHLPIIANATFYLSRESESSWYSRILLLQGHPLLDLGYRWSFESMTIGLGSTYIYGPNVLSGPDFTGFIGASIGARL